MYICKARQLWVKSCRLNYLTNTMRMKKIFLAALALVAMLGANQAQAQSQFRKGDKAINIDFALGSEGWGDGSATAGFSFMGEYGFMNVINEKGTISAGLLLGAGFSGDDYYDFSRIRIGTRGALHYSFIPKLDTYAGLNFLFVDIEKVKFTYADGDFETDDEIESKETDCKFVAPALVAGCRYMFNEHLGANVELSWDRFQHVGVGLTYKL